MIIAGAEITDAVVEIIEDLQSNLENIRNIKDAVTKISEFIVSNTDNDPEAESKAMEYLRALHFAVRVIEGIAQPADADLEENDIPVIEL